MDWKTRFQQAHEYNFKREYPNAHKDGHYFPPEYPDVKKANGLTNAITKYINWMGYRATRINVAGRLVEGTEKQPESGTVLKVKKFMKSTTRKGTADISSTIDGRSLMIEIKVGKDTPSPAQLKEQDKERRAGGAYEFIHDMDEFFTLYDSFAAQKSLF